MYRTHYSYRTRNITSGVRLQPIRVQTPYINTGTKKKSKKRKHRKRSTSKSNKAFEKKEKSKQATLVQKQVTYDYYSDFEDFEDDSSNDEGFASGQATSMSERMSPVHMVTNQFTPRLATMTEEDEANLETETFKPNNVTKENETKAPEAKLEIKEDLLAAEESWDIILQPHVSKEVFPL